MSYCQEGRNPGAEMLVVVQPRMTRTLSYWSLLKVQLHRARQHLKNTVSRLPEAAMCFGHRCSMLDPQRGFPHLFLALTTRASHSPVCTESIACRREVYSRSRQAYGSSGIALTTAWPRHRRGSFYLNSNRAPAIKVRGNLCGGASQIRGRIPGHGVHT